ncbi:MAG: hypothetical protein A2W19_14100 [Spirochaetes bacterium RBG_16_49_21]|nr:MAG: hypothetical protein A2W19_14100 [Spirochaetes bacterium RBG_16_49_21]
MNRAIMNCLLIFCAFTAPLNISCRVHSAPPTEEAYWNDAARYLAGMELDHASVLRDKADEPAYRNHVQFMNNLWVRIRTETINPILPWRDKNIPGVCKNVTAFYPLSGADIINLYLMFPDASTYIMVALEKPGDVDFLRDYKSRRLINGLLPIQQSIYLYGMNNYFQSRVMIQEMNNPYLPGTAPVLLIFMARLGFFVNKVENITIDDSGEIVPFRAEAPAMEPGKITGVRIYFTRNGDWKMRKLVYLSMKLTPDSTNPSAPEGRYLNRFRDVRTLLKSAVYLLHYKSYKPIRDFLLRRSVLIVQDDSGIPYGSFDAGWEIKLYGVYRPYLYLGGCRPIMQNDLEQSYRNKSYALPFNFGYGILSGPHQSNLMVALKKL